MAEAGRGAPWASQGGGILIPWIEHMFDHLSDGGMG